MDIIYLLIPIAVILVIVGLSAFFWAVKNDQFEDLEGPAHSILFDDPEDDPPIQSRTTPPDDRNGDAGE